MDSMKSFGSLVIYGDAIEFTYNEINTLLK